MCWIVEVGAPFSARWGGRLFATAVVILVGVGFTQKAWAQSVWNDAATGQAVRTGSGPYVIAGTTVATPTGAQTQVQYYPIRPDAADPNRAFIPQTGQNLVLVADTTTKPAGTPGSPSIGGAGVGFGFGFGFGHRPMDQDRGKMEKRP